MLPPSGSYNPPPVHKEPKKGIWGAILAALAAIAKFGAAIGKFLYPAFKLFKMSKVLLTSGSMLLSVWFYALMFGWKFALGFVLCIFVHEMGHVFVAWRQGIPVSAPIFIPGFGALILQKQSAKSAWAEALIGIGGPIGGTLASLLCWALYASTGNLLFLGLAYTGFFMNLFNLTPMFPLDGGWIVAAIHPWLWVIGAAMLGTMFVTGFIHNPLIIILILMGIPRMWMAIKNKTFDRPGGEVTTPQQKWIMGVSYIGLAAFLAWSMAITHIDPSDSRRTRPRGQVASIQGSTQNL